MRHASPGGRESEPAAASSKQTSAPSQSPTSCRASPSTRRISSPRSSGPRRSTAARTSSASPSDSRRGPHRATKPRSSPARSTGLGSAVSVQRRASAGCPCCSNHRAASTRVVAASADGDRAVPSPVPAPRPARTSRMSALSVSHSWAAPGEATTSPRRTRPVSAAPVPGGPIAAARSGVKRSSAASRPSSSRTSAGSSERPIAGTEAVPGRRGAGCPPGEQRRLPEAGTGDHTGQPTPERAVESAFEARPSDRRRLVDATRKLVW
jgi:hypothetical protein